MTKLEYVLAFIFTLWLTFLFPITIFVSKIADNGEHLLAIKIIFIYGLIGVIDLLIIGFLKGDSSNE